MAEIYGCHPYSEILTSKGHRTINEITEGTVLKVLLNKIAKVHKVSSIPYKGTLLGFILTDIDLDSGYCTPDQEVCIQRGNTEATPIWTPVICVRVGDYLCTPGIGVRPPKDTDDYKMVSGVVFSKIGRISKKLFTGNVYTIAVDGYGSYVSGWMSVRSVGVSS